MRSAQGFQPDWVSPPGDTIRSVLRERGIAESDFSRQIELSSGDLQNLLEGRMTISIRVARKLSEALGASVEFWMSRDFQYRQDAARLCRVDEEWLTTLPISDMVKFGWLQPAPRPSDELAACLNYFGVPSVIAWKRIYGQLQDRVAFRTSRSFQSKPAAVATWLRQGEIEAERIDCGPWNPETLRRSIEHIRSLTRRKDPSHFLPELQRCCAAAGVAVTIVRSPTGCRASGVVRLLSPRKALIQLSFRYLSDDQFWFTFFHEVGHLLLHEPEEVVLEEEGDEPNTNEENEANEFAANTLVPRQHQGTMMKLGANSRDVIRFALRIGVSPGIVVGQLQHKGRLRRNQLNSLKRRFAWVTDFAE